MASVQHSSPEDPYPFSLQSAEEGASLSHQATSTYANCGNRPSPTRRTSRCTPSRWPITGRQQFFDGWLLGADELIEEAPFGQNLVDHDGADWVRLFMRFEVEHAIGNRPPHVDRLVRLAGVGGHDMLECRLDGLRQLASAMAMKS